MMFVAFVGAWIAGGIGTLVLLMRINPDHFDPKKTDWHSPEFQRSCVFWREVRAVTLWPFVLFGQAFRYWCDSLFRRAQERMRLAEESRHEQAAAEREVDKLLKSI